LLSACAYILLLLPGDVGAETVVPRIASLSEQAKALERRASELVAHEDDEQPERTNAAELDALRSTLCTTLKDSAPTRARPCSKP
jgi:hypothetical protein